MEQLYYAPQAGYAQGMEHSYDEKCGHSHDNRFKVHRYTLQSERYQVNYILLHLLFPEVHSIIKPAFGNSALSQTETVTKPLVYVELGGNAVG